MNIICLIAAGLFWIAFALLVLGWIIFAIALVVAVVAFIVGTICSFFPLAAWITPIADTIALVAFIIALCAGAAAFVCTLIAGGTYWLMVNVLRCRNPFALSTAAASGFTQSSGGFPFLPSGLPFPNLPGFDWVKFLECLATAMTPCHCAGGDGGRFPLPKDPKDIWKDALGLIREGKRVLEEGQREAEERANELKDWIEQAGDKATQEAKDLAKQAEKEANKFKEGAKTTSATVGQVLSNIPPFPLT